MKPSEHYQNLFPLEPLLPDLDEMEVQVLVMTCDYTIEADEIAEEDEIPNGGVNTADATVFYMMGYERAQKELEKKLKTV